MTTWRSIGTLISSVDAAKFDKAMSAIQGIIDDGVTDLDALAGPLRGDGLPQDWVDDLVSLTPSQVSLLDDKLSTFSSGWSNALRVEIGNL